MLRKLAGAAVPILMLCVAAGAAELAGLWLDVPFVEQQKNGCGAASIAMVMQYWGMHEGQSWLPEAEPSQIYSSLYSESAHGIYASDMVRYFQQNGYRAFAFTGAWADIERELQKGRPLIVALKPGFSPSLHYVVVVGLNAQQRLVLVNDPAQRKLLSEDQSQFDREWKAAGYWTLLAVPEPSARVSAPGAPASETAVH
jgi:ABC-type bacteriocin/lantibiotic exporter with double-glycine peptidase domain